MIWQKSGLTLTTACHTHAHPTNTGNTPQRVRETEQVTVLGKVTPFGAAMESD